MRICSLSLARLLHPVNLLLFDFAAPTMPPTAQIKAPSLFLARTCQREFWWVYRVTGFGQPMHFFCPISCFAQTVQFLNVAYEGTVSPKIKIIYSHSSFFLKRSLVDNPSCSIPCSWCQKWLQKKQTITYSVFILGELFLKIFQQATVNGSSEVNKESFVCKLFQSPPIGGEASVEASKDCPAPASEPSSQEATPEKSRCTTFHSVCVYMGVCVCIYMGVCVYIYVCVYMKSSFPKRDKCQI